MSNKTYSQFTFSSEKAPVVVYAQINIGAAGAPTLARGSHDIASVVLNSAGDYTITMKETFNALMGVNLSILNTTAPAAPEMWIKAQAVATAKTVEIVMNAAGTPTNPGSGEVLLLQLIMKNSSV